MYNSMIRPARVRQALSAAMVCGLLVSPGMLQAQTAPAAAADAPAASKTVATTVFVDAQAGARKDGSAKRLNKSHADMEAKGWRFADLEPYTENGDLVGFFVTYVK